MQLYYYAERNGWRSIWVMIITRLTTWYSDHISIVERNSAVSICVYNIISCIGLLLTWTVCNIQLVPRSTHFSVWKQVIVMCGNNRCLLWDKYKTHKYTVRAEGGNFNVKADGILSNH